MAFRIAVIDDQELDIELLKIVSQKTLENVEVCGFKDPVKGLDFISKYADEVDVVFLDVLLDGCNGIDVLKKIRSQNKTKHLNVFILTGHNEGDSILEAYKEDADGFITKPITKVALKKCILNIDNVDKHCPIRDCAKLISTCGKM